MLKQLFGSRARIKLLQKFLLHPEKEFYVRELTRCVDEQINGVRRELDNLRKIGLLRQRTKARKKYYFVNKEHVLFTELRHICMKALLEKKDLVQSIQVLGDVDFLLLSGVYTKNKHSQVDLFVVGDIDKDTFSEFIDFASKTAPIRYSLLSKENFLYRYTYNDSFVHALLGDSKNSIAINTLEDQLGRGIS